MQRPAKAWTSVRFRPRPPILGEILPSGRIDSGPLAPCAKQKFALDPWRPSRRLVRRHPEPLDVRLFRGSSAVEQPAVNRLVVGSNPTRGANHLGVRPGDMGDKTYLRHG